MGKHRGIALAVVIALALSACSRDEAGGSPERQTTSAEADRPKRAASPETTAVPEAPTPADARFDESHTWPDGLEITVGAPTRVTPEGSAVDSSLAYVRMVVRVKNGSDEEYRPSLTFTTPRSGSTPGTTVMLSDAEPVGPPAAVRPGGEIAFAIGLGVENPSAPVVEVSPGPGYPPAVFAD